MESKQDWSRLHLAAATFFILIVVLVCNSWGIASAPFARTEAHRVIIAKQMLESGHYLVPQLYDHVLMTKPPGHYWILALSQWLGDSAAEWVCRLPSALASAALASFLCWLVGRRLGTVAGIVTGAGYFALVALWSQSQSADLDAINTTAVVIAGCAILELAQPTRSRTWLWVVIGSIAFSVSLYYKGPACLAVLLAVLSSAMIVHRRLLPVPCGSIWLLLLVGVSSFCVWGGLAYLELEAHPEANSVRGVREATSKLAWLWNGEATTVLATTAKLLALSFPPVMVLPFWLRSSIWRHYPETTRRWMSCYFWAYVNGLIIGTLLGLDNVRYGYPVLPFLAPLVGCVGDAWRRSLYSDQSVRRLRRAVLVAAFATVIGQVVLAVRVGNQGPPSALVLVAVAAACCVTVTAVWRRQHSLQLSSLTVAGLILFSVTFAHFKSAEKVAHSAHSAAITLRRHIGVGNTVATGDMLLHKPEIFFYSNAAVVSHVGKLSNPKPLTEDGWVLLRHYEYRRWNQREKRRLSRLAKSDLPGGGVIIAWYENPGESGGRAAVAAGEKKTKLPR